MLAKFDLATMAKRATNRRNRSVVIRSIITTRAQAQDLARFYLRPIKALEERVARLLVLYEREVNRAIAHDAVSDLGNELDEISTALQRLVVELTPAMRRYVLRTEEWHRGKWRRAVLDAVSVNLTTMMGAEEVRDTLEAFLARNVALIRNINEEARGRIADAVFRGFQRRSSARDIAKDIREATGMARRRAIRVAGDQIVKLASDLDGERIRQAGIDKWKWRHSGKKHPREEHKARDGNIYTDKTAPEDLPGQLPFCGCTREAVLEL